MIKQPVKYFLVSLMILESLFVIAQHPDIDKKAPKIEITEWVTNELNVENPFQGKTIILEFWTTWCAPCLAALPHLNELSDEFAGEKVVFLSITYEKREKVEKLLTRKTFKSTVVIDTTKNTFQAFGVKSIPKTFLIDENGILKWHGSPYGLTDEFLRKFLTKGEVPKIVKSKNTQQINYESEGKNSVYTLTIEYADREEKGSRSKTGFKENKTIIEFYNYKLEDIIVSLLGLSQSKIEVIGKSLNTSLIIGFKVETALMKFKKSKSLLVDILCKTFSFEIKKQTIEKEGWSMTCPNDELLESYNIPKSQKVSSSMSSNSEEWIGTQITIAVLQKALENQFNVIVFDDTDLAYHYDFRFPLKNKKSAKEYLEKEYGIILNEAKKFVEITVLDFENKIK